MKKLAIVTTHPIQYYAPIFKLLQQRDLIAVRVYYTLGQQPANYDPGFSKNIVWDIPLLDGYDYEWAENTSATPGSHHPKGIITPELINRIMRFQPDAILVFGWNYTSHLKVLRYFKNKVPVYFRGDSTLLNYTTFVKELVKSIYLKWVYRHITHAFYVGVNNKAYFKKYGLQDSQLTFASHAIDNDRFKISRSADTDRFRRSLNLSSEDILIVFAGKFEPVKNLKLLVAAVANLNKPNVHLLLVGNGINEHVLKSQADLSIARDNIHFIDFVNQADIPVVFHAADIYCLPSVSETWGLSVNEAMACNKAILVSDKVGCAADLVKENYNGAIFKNNDEKSLTEALTVLTRSKTVLQEYGKNSGIIIQKWNFTAIAEAIENKLLNEPD
nr:glycosyltransferase family 4 protein [Mucilaginibacter sp. L294]